MKFVAAECTQCGAKIQINSDKTSGNCPHCGTRFVLENADQIKNGNILLELCEYSRARKAFLRAIEEAPGNCEAWWGIVKSLTGNFRLYVIDDWEEIDNAWMNARQLADEDRWQEMLAEWTDWKKRKDEFELETDDDWEFDLDDDEEQDEVQEEVKIVKPKPLYPVDLRKDGWYARKMGLSQKLFDVIPICPLCENKPKWHHKLLSDSKPWKLIFKCNYCLSEIRVILEYAKNQKFWSRFFDGKTITRIEPLLIGKKNLNELETGTEYSIEKINEILNSRGEHEKA